MKKFEYRCVSIIGDGAKTEVKLNEYGGKGWELVSVTGVWHYFKREIQFEG